VSSCLCGRESLLGPRGLRAGRCPSGALHAACVAARVIHHAGCHPLWLLDFRRCRIKSAASPRVNYALILRSCNGSRQHFPGLLRARHVCARLPGRSVSNREPMRVPRLTVSGSARSRDPAECSSLRRCTNSVNMLKKPGWRQLPVRDLCVWSRVFAGSASSCRSSKTSGNEVMRAGTIRMELP
jgi:hypothetical protein